MRRQTKAQKFNDIANVIHQIRAGEPVKRIGAKDGSIATHPVVPCPDVVESIVKVECIKWLREHHIFCNGHDCGSGDIVGAGQATYGIMYSGDIHGILREDHGRHFEIECKRGRGGRLSAGQRKRMKQVRDNNGLYFVIHGVPELEFYFKRYIK